MAKDLKSLKKIFASEINEECGAAFTNCDDHAVEKDLTSPTIIQAVLNSVLSDVLSLPTPKARLDYLRDEGR